MQSARSRRMFLSAYTVVALCVFLISTLASAQPQYTYQTIDVPFDGLGWTRITGITSKGSLVGTFLDRQAGEHSWLYRHTTGKFEHVSQRGITELVVQDINDPKRMSGTYRDRGVPHAFTKKGKQFTTIRVPGAEQAEASGINNEGVIVGTYGDAVGGFHAFVYQATTKTVITLDVPGASFTTASGINNNGHIVGSFDDIHHATTHGWRFVNGVFTTIDAPCGESTNIEDINDAGQMAVACFTGDGGTFSYAFDGMTFTPLEVPGAFVTQVSRLNNAGQFVGWYSGQDGKDHGFIATPPASAAILDGRARLQYAQVNHGVSAAEFLTNRPPLLRIFRP